MPASGIHLDRLGKIVGELRQGRADDPYAAAIRVRILSNRSEGTPDDLLAIARLLLKAGTIVYNEGTKAYTVFGLGDATVVEALVTALRRADPAGVGSDIVVGLGASAAVIRYGDSGDATVGTGFPSTGDTDPDAGYAA